MTVNNSAIGFVGSSTYDPLPKLSIRGKKKRTKSLKVLAETDENGFLWLWGREINNCLIMYKIVLIVENTN